MRLKLLVARLADAAVVVLAAAMMACWGHLATAFLWRQVFGVFSWQWWLRDQVLLSSIGYPLVFGILGVIPIAVHVAWPRGLTLARLAGLEVALGSLAILLLFQRVAPWGLVVLAAGMGVATIRRLTHREDSLRRWSRRLAAAGIAASAVVSVASIGTRALSERRDMRGLAQAAADAPNVILIILDTVRAASFGLYGGPVDNTPHLAARVAREGVVFDSAYSTASWTLPSHASIFTGQYASLTGADWKAPLGTRLPTLAEVFRARGFATGGFSANTVAGWHGTGLSRGFIRYDDAKRSVTEAFFSTTITQTKSTVAAYTDWWLSGWQRGAIQKYLLTFSLRPDGNYTWHDPISADDVAGNFLDWQRGLKGRPFFAFVNFFDAHDPYAPPVPYRTLYGSDGQAINRYLGAIRYMDDVVDRLLVELERRGALQNAIVVIASDHGESFQEHSLVGHGNGLYRNQIHVPLVILGRHGLTGGTHVPQPVSLRDLGSTMLDLAGIDQHPLGGTSLRTAMSSGSGAPASAIIAEVSRGINVKSTSFAGRADQKSVVGGDMHVIESSLGTLDVFAIDDSLELNNLVAEPGKRSAALDLITRTLEANGISWRPPR